MKKAKNIIAVVLILIAFVLLGYSFFSEENPSNEFVSYLDIQDEPVSDTSLSKYLNLDAEQQYDGLLLYVVASEFCSTCINEIIEFIEVTDKYLKSSLNDYKIYQHAFIIGDEKADYIRVNKLLEFPFNSSLVKKNSELALHFRQWKGEASGINQLVLISPNENIIKGRIGIFNTSTQPFEKKNLVREVLFELEH